MESREKNYEDMIVIRSPSPCSCSDVFYLPVLFPILGKNFSTWRKLNLVDNSAVVLAQEPITWSLHLPYILESGFARIVLFLFLFFYFFLFFFYFFFYFHLEQFSPQASLKSRESILYSALYCVVLC